MRTDMTRFFERLTFSTPHELMETSCVFSADKRIVEAQPKIKEAKRLCNWLCYQENGSTMLDGVVNIAEDCHQKTVKESACLII